MIAIKRPQLMMISLRAEKQKEKKIICKYMQYKEVKTD